MSEYAPGVTVVIPTIAPRAESGMAQRAAESAAVALGNLAGSVDTKPFIGAVLLQVDSLKQGAARTRHAGLEMVGTEWVAFLDDDDEFLPDHLMKLHTAALEHQADYVWSRFRITYPDGSCLSGPQFLGEKAFRQWDDADPCQTTITTLVKTELAIRAGGFAQFDDTGALVDGQRRGEDHEFTLRCRAAGGVFRHVPQVTWKWNHHGGNTSGLPDRW